MPLLRNALTNSVQKRNHLIPISVSIKKRRALKIPLFETYERTISGFEKPLIQRVSANSMTGKIVIGIHNQGAKKSEPNLGVLEARIHGKRKNKTAQITEAKIVPAYQNTGLFIQMLAEALEVLKKNGVKEVKATVLKGQKTYAALGFEAEEMHETCTIMKKVL